jgi:hypothetical protein
MYRKPYYLFGKSTHNPLKLPIHCQCTFQITNCVNVPPKLQKNVNVPLMTKMPFIKLLKKI